MAKYMRADFFSRGRPFSAYIRSIASSICWIDREAVDGVGGEEHDPTGANALLERHTRPIVTRSRPARSARVEASASISLTDFA